MSLRSNCHTRTSLRLAVSGLPSREAYPEVYAQTNEPSPRMPIHSSSASDASSVGGILIQTASWLALLSWDKTFQCLCIFCNAWEKVIRAACGMLEAAGKAHTQRRLPGCTHQQGDR